MKHVKNTFRKKCVLCSCFDRTTWKSQ